MRRLGRWLRDAWLVAGVTLLLVLVVDAGLREWAGPEDWPRVSPGATPPDRREAPLYRSYAPADAYWSEHRAARAMRWHAYSYWRREPHTGTAINVDAHGIRRTVGGGTAEAEVWVLGGSSVWGTGVADADTLPSWLAALLAQAGRPVRVVNLGESGYVTGQSLAYLQYRLRREDPPEVLVFVEGANDVFAALQAGEAGLPQNEGNRRRDFRVTDGIEHYLLAFPRALEGVRGFLAPASPDIAGGALARDVVAVYRANRTQARVLAAAHGAVTVHAWQPTVFGRAGPPPFETAIVAGSHAAHRDLQRAVDALMAREVDDGQLLLTPLFDASDEPAFLDALHLGPAANRRLAEALVPAVIAALDAAAPSRP